MISVLGYPSHCDGFNLLMSFSSACVYEMPHRTISSVMIRVAAIATYDESNKPLRLGVEAGPMLSVGRRR
jgi:hypothetical protein